MAGITGHHFYGIAGDATSGGTQIKYVDPWDGRFHTMSFDSMVQGHETGFTMVTRCLTAAQLGRFSQIIHYSMGADYREQLWAQDIK